MGKTKCVLQALFVCDGDCKSCATSLFKDYDKLRNEFITYKQQTQGLAGGLSSVTPKQ